MKMGTRGMPVGCREEGERNEMGRREDDGSERVGGPTVSLSRAASYSTPPQSVNL